MFCKKCGQQLPDDAKFCTICGYKLSDTNIQTDINGGNVTNNLNNSADKFHEITNSSKKIFNFSMDKIVFICLTIVNMIAFILPYVSMSVFGMSTSSSLIEIPYINILFGIVIVLSLISILVNAIECKQKRKWNIFNYPGIFSCVNMILAIVFFASVKSIMSIPPDLKGLVNYGLGAYLHLLSAIGMFATILIVWIIKKKVGKKHEIH